MENKYTYPILCFCLLVFHFSTAQSVQNIRGKVYDKDNRLPLIGANILVQGEKEFGITTDMDGNFLLEGVPVGRYTLTCNYLGYSEFVTNEVLVTAAKEVQLEIALVEAKIEIETVTIKAKKFGNEPLNELAVISARSFGVEETQRYAASANDPSRMVVGFPGVQPSRDDRNDIIVRGNSAMGLLWRLEGIDIPNPNHFARRGSSGGGITVFSVSTLSNSDFYTASFPAEYGNAFSGVFDLKLRNGNKFQREHTFRAGMLGVEFATEGPIKSGKSSYLMNYRYSTLGILDAFGIRLVDERERNTFQDLSFKLNFNSKNLKHDFSIWGIGGISEEFVEALEDQEEWRSFTDYMTRKFNTDLGVLGMNHTWQISQTGYIKNSLGLMSQKITYVNDTLDQNRVATTFNDELHQNNRLTFSSVLHQKLGNAIGLKGGFFLSHLIYDLNRDYLIQDQYESLIAVDGNSQLIQPFVSLRWDVSPKLNLVVGAHSLFFNLNNTSSVEPRFGAKYQLNENHSLQLGYGLHSRINPIGTYFYEEAGQRPNLDLKLIKAHHLVLGYKYVLASGLKLTTEVYYQSLFDVPVSSDPNSTYSILNQIDGYAIRPLISEGTGTNVGLDVTFEKAFRNNTFFLISASIYDSQYEALDGTSYNTTYNGGFSTAFVGGREWKVSDNKILQLGLRLIYNGGQRLSPILSNERDPFEPMNPILDESRPFTEQVPNFFRPDLRIAYRHNGNDLSWILSLDIQNAIARENINAIDREFDPDLNQWIFMEQSSLVPILTYQIDF